MTTSSSTFERSNRVMKVTMGIKIKVDRMIEKIVDAPAHNCSVLLSILMDIEWMSTKKKSVIIVHDVKSSERKSFITPSKIKGGDEETPEEWNNEGEGGNILDGPYAKKRVHDYYT